MKDHPAGCRGCPADKYGLGFVPPHGKPDAPFAFLGSGPGETETHQDRPFTETAPSGWRLAKWRRRAGMQDANVWLGHAVQCWLPKTRYPTPRGQRDPTEAEIRHCWQAHVGPAVHALAAAGSHLIPVGTPATRWILGVESTMKYVGTHIEVSLPTLSGVTLTEEPAKNE